jgi:hypothetical protein
VVVSDEVKRLKAQLKETRAELKLADEVIGYLTDAVHHMPTSLGDLLGEERYRVYKKYMGYEEESDE